MQSWSVPSILASSPPPPSPSYMFSYSLISDSHRKPISLTLLAGGNASELQFRIRPHLRRRSVTTPLISLFLATTNFLITRVPCCFFMPFLNVSCPLRALLLVYRLAAVRNLGIPAPLYEIFVTGALQHLPGDEGERACFVRHIRCPGALHINLHCRATSSSCVHPA